MSCLYSLDMNSLFSRNSCKLHLCKYFWPFCKLYLHFVNSFLCCAKPFKFNYVSFLYFSSYFFSSAYNLILKQIDKHWLDHPSLLWMSSVKNLCITSCYKPLYSVITVGRNFVMLQDLRTGPFYLFFPHKKTYREYLLQIFFS